jgi:hypothetical protein
LVVKRLQSCRSQSLHWWVVGGEKEWVIVKKRKMDIKTRIQRF